MELKETVTPNLVEFALAHLNYSFKDVESYEDLTEEEKEMISEDLFYESFKDSISKEKEAFRKARTHKIYIG